MPPWGAVVKIQGQNLVEKILLIFESMTIVQEI